MRRRHPLPTVWLMTDRRISDLDAAIARLPRKAGIVFRHYHLAKPERRALFDRVRAIARRKRHVLLLADTPATAQRWGADGAHDRGGHRSLGLRTAAVHNRAELIAGKRIKADLLFVSPAFATRSHPGKTPLGGARLGLLVGASRTITIALGGMTKTRFRSLVALNLYGWAGIDAF